MKDGRKKERDRETYRQTEINDTANNDKTQHVQQRKNDSKYSKN